jgi:hypothetical protein
LDGRLYREVAVSADATWQAFALVGVGAIASGIGAATGAVDGPFEGVAAAALRASADTLITWFILSHILFCLGVLILRARVSYVGALRALAFAYSLGVLDALRSLPIAGIVVSTLVGLWSLAAAYVTVRAGFQLGHWRSIAVVAASIFLYAVIRVQLKLVTGV